MINSYAKLFSWNVICAVCRKKIKAEEATKRWDGLIVCSEDNEQRHPLDMPQPPIREQAPIPFSSMEPTDTFQDACTTHSSIADEASADCLIADRENDTRIYQGTFGSGL